MAKKKRKPKIKWVTILADDLVLIFQESSWDRPSAYFGLCGAAKIRGEVPELAMHARDETLGWEGDSPKALEHMEKHFGVKNLPTFFNGAWDT